MREGPDKLTYYRKAGAVLSVPGTEAHRYPAFQFDPVRGDLHPSAVIANRRLLRGGPGSEDERWAALEWWNAPLIGEPAVSPRRALADGVLDRWTLDALLDPLDDE